MRLKGLVDVSNAVSHTRSRREKTAALAALLKQLQGREIPIGVSYLSGSLPQGRIGLGWSAISGAQTTGASDTPSLELLDADAIFEQIAHTSGAGAVRTRTQLLIGLFTRATRDEQDFLIRLISGDLRQGALEGVLAEAVAKAVPAPADAVRQAAMMCGNLGEVAHAAFTEGAAALARYFTDRMRRRPTSAGRRRCPPAFGSL